ncbi:MAG: hypothetical protein EOO71_33885, partial [Myxococcaceae bacterium]
MNRLTSALCFALLVPGLLLAAQPLPRPAGAAVPPPKGEAPQEPPPPPAGRGRGCAARSRPGTSSAKQRAEVSRFT